MSEQKWYYDILDKETGEIQCSCAINLHIKEEKVCELLGIDNYTAREITKEEYEEGSADEE